MWSRSIALAALAAVALLAGCSAESSEPTTPNPGPGATSSAPAGPPSSATTEPASPSPSAAAPSASQDAGGTELSAADDAVTWTMPCPDPEQQELRLDDDDRKDLVSARTWRCGQPPNTSAAAIVAQLQEAPETDDDAHRALRAAAEQMVKGDKPEHGTYQGHPGVTNEITQNGRTFAYQGVSVGTYLVFFVAPADQLSALTDTVTIEK